MSSLIYPEQPHDVRLWRAVIASLALHALVVMVYPHLSHMTLPKLPERLDIEMFTIKTQPPIAPAVTTPEQPVVPVKTTPAPVAKPSTPSPKPVLSVPDQAPTDYKVAEPPVTAKAEPSPVPPAPVTASTANVSAESAAHASTETSNAKESKSSAPAAPPSSKESDELTDSDTDAWGDYGEQLRNLVSKSKQYPAIAIRRHLEGEAVVVAQFIRGELVNVSLADSSKHVPLDEEAMRMVKKAIAQLGVKDSLKKKSFKITIPVAFKLE